MQDHFDFEETDLYAEVTYTGKPEKITNLFELEFQDLWSPEEIGHLMWKVYVFDQEGFSALSEFLNKELGAKNYQAQIINHY